MFLFFVHTEVELPVIKKPETSAPASILCFINYLQNMATGTRTFECLSAEIFYSSLV